MAGGPQALRSGEEPAEPPVPVDGPVDEPVVLHAATTRASARRARDRRRGVIGDSVAKSVGTCRRGRMAAS